MEQKFVSQKGYIKLNPNNKTKCSTKCGRNIMNKFDII